MDFADIAAILTEINKMATGQEPTSPIVNTSSFVSVAQATLLTGTDNYTKAISQVLGRTIFAVRPYDAPLKRLQVTGDDWSNHVRKINFCDTDPVTDKAWALVDGQSVDMYEVHKPKVLQTNYYGQTNYSRVYTQADTQMEAAFKGPEELAQFWSSFVLHLSNQIEADRRNLANNLMANHLTGMTVTSPNSVVYLLDEYNAQQGTSLTDKHQNGQNCINVHITSPPHIDTSKSQVLALADACPPLLGAASGHLGLTLIYDTRIKKSSTAILAKENFIRVSLKLNLPLQIRGPDIPIRGPESFTLIIASAICGHLARPMPTHIVEGFTLVLIDATPPNLNKRVVFPEGPGYNKTFLLGAVLVFNSGPIKVRSGHRPIEGRIGFLFGNRAVHKINQKNPFIGQ
jgi:hypothetical protein